MQKTWNYDKECIQLPFPISISLEKVYQSGGYKHGVIENK